MLRSITGVNYVSNKVKKLKDDTNVKIEKAKENAVKGGIVVLVLGSVIWLSIFIYILFYYTYIPPVLHSKPIYLQFNTCDNDTESKICSFLTAHIELTRKHQLLMVGQKYSVSVELELPESEQNRQQGMFLVCVELTSSDGALLSHGCRSTMLRYSSWLLRCLRTVFFIPAYLFGSAEEKQTVKVEVISDFIDDKMRPVTDAYVEVRSRRVQVYSARLLMAAHFSGLRHMMYHWPTLSGLSGVGLVLGTLLMLIGLSWHQVAQGDGLAARATRHLTQRLAAFVDEDLDFIFEDQDDSQNDSKDSQDNDEEFWDCGPPNDINVSCY